MEMHETIEKERPLNVARVIILEILDGKFDRKGNLKEKILFLKRAFKVANGQWCLPEGKVNYNKKIAQSAAEEVK